jgi:hypothetical protein
MLVCSSSVWIGLGSVSGKTQTRYSLSLVAIIPASSEGQTTFELPTGRTCSHKRECTSAGTANTSTCPRVLGPSPNIRLLPSQQTVMPVTGRPAKSRNSVVRGDRREKSYGSQPKDHSASGAQFRDQNHKRPMSRGRSRQACSSGSRFCWPRFSRDTKNFLAGLPTNSFGNLVG